MRGAPLTEVAYVLKAYPRLSETYITSEIHRVEQAGVRVHLFSMNEVEPWEKAARYPVLERIEARCVYLPPATSTKKVSTARWLRDNLPAFAPALLAVAPRRPLRTARALRLALGNARRARRAGTAKTAKVQLREFLQAVALSREVLRRPAIGLLHAHYAHDATTVAWLASIITGRPFSFTGHARDIYADWRNPAGLLRRKLEAAAFTVTCTEANARHLLEIAPAARVHRIYHGLDAEVARIVDTGPERPDHNGRLHLLGVGRLVRKKGFDVLVEACGELDRAGVAFDAVIAGPDGEHGDEVRARIGELGLGDRVTLAGPLDQDSLCAAYRRADALLQPCRLLADDRDGIPNVLVEAMACGVPVVTTGVSGIPELVTDGVNGLLVEPDDPVALAAAVRRLAGDRELAIRLAWAGRRTVAEHFDGTREAARLVELFTEASR
jgi:glycosyltransferase involved in cell wall biosynthesis